MAIMSSYAEQCHLANENKVSVHMRTYAVAYTSS